MRLMLTHRYCIVWQMKCFQTEYNALVGIAIAAVDASAVAAAAEFAAVSNADAIITV